MEKIKDFYRGLSDKRKIVLWVCIVVVALSAIRASSWIRRGSGMPRTREYMQKLSSPDDSVRKFAVYVLGRERVKQAVPALKKVLLEDGDDEIRRTAAWSIGSIDKAELVSMLDSEEYRAVRDIVMDTLMVKSIDNISYLFARLDGQDEKTKLRILAYADNSRAARHQDKLMDVLENREESMQVRIKAAELLRKRGTAELERRLWYVYYNDPDRQIKQLSYDLINELKGR